jgi:nucleoside-diphosphate-sugar epimerase
MENLITTLRHQVVAERCLAMPSGSATFNWIAVSDIAACAAILLADGFSETHPSYTFAGNENLTMDEVALRLQNVLGFSFPCRHPNVLRYAFREWRRTKSMTFVGVMLLLHWLPKFGPGPERSDDLQKLLGRPATSLDTWISDNRSAWDKPT